MNVANFDLFGRWSLWRKLATLIQRYAGLKNGPMTRQFGLIDDTADSLAEIISEWRKLSGL
jgi:hypothetical protein